MPSRNVVREFVEGGYYHVYNRGVEKRVIFLDDEDYTVFLGLLKRYLGDETRDKKNRHKLPKISNEVQVLAYCLMPNHFHLLLHQTSEDGVQKLMRRVSTGYVMYFNHKYTRVGSLFQGPYKASHINADAYLHHISRYIHLNPTEYVQWPYSSYRYYVRTKEPPNWLSPDSVLELFEGPEDYAEFVADYVDTRNELALLKWQLANALTD